MDSFEEEGEWLWTDTLMRTYFSGGKDALYKKSSFITPLKAEHQNSHSSLRFSIDSPSLQRDGVTLTIRLEEQEWKELSRYF